MYSPTTNILNSIQALKSKLRDDHQQLQFIRKQFSLPPTKQLPQEMQEITHESETKLQNKYRSDQTVDKSVRIKMVELRKKYQQELNQFKSEIIKEKEKIINQYQTTIEQMKQRYEERIKDQENYIILLEEQISTSRGPLKQCVYNSQSKKQQEQIKEQQIREQKQKYQHIINQLMQENALLIKIIESSKTKLKKSQKRACSSSFLYQSRQRQQQPVELRNNQLFVEKNDHNPLRNKSRLKFSKVDSYSRRSLSNANSERPSLNFKSRGSNQQPMLKKITAYISEFNKQNINSSNVAEQNDDDSILNEEMKIKTIKHFWTNQQNALIHQFR